MTDQQQRILDAIPYGKDNAIKNHTLALRTGFTDREVQKVIESIIDEEKAPICASCKGKMGYFQPINSDEMDLYHRQLTSRVNKVLERLSHSKRMMKREFPGGQTRMVV